VKSIRDKAVAMEVYAKQAKDGVLIARDRDPKRAERRLGELIEIGVGAETYLNEMLARLGQQRQTEAWYAGLRKREGEAPQSGSRAIPKISRPSCQDAIMNPRHTKL
jgi:thiamine pyrophosphate-dependent acetolactate synthase large subunit-like protein